MYVLMQKEKRKKERFILLYRLNSTDLAECLIDT